jgi:GTP 3',8-cyclase
VTAETVLRDAYGRTIRDLRISVTDRCNFKCFYCKSSHGLVPGGRERLLSYEEIERSARIFVGLGVTKLRVTGGEPMLRRDLEVLIEKLAQLPGLEDLALTTNGFNLHERAATLKQAGLQRVTVSLDSLNPDRFREITTTSDIEKVVRSIRTACRLELNPVKVNCVVIRGINDDEIGAFAEFARNEGVHVRFIEFMPLDEAGRWNREQVVTGAEILESLQRHYPLRPLPSENPAETSRNYVFADSPGSIGLIMPVSVPFCGACSRIRLTADGKIRTCLFSLVEHDLKPFLREDRSDAEVIAFLREVVDHKEPGHRINEPDFVAPSRSMSFIGG